MAKRFFDGLSGMRKVSSARGREGYRLQAAGLAVASAACLAGSLLLAGCQTVTGYTQSSLVRVIDASYNAPAVNVYIENTLVAANIGQGSITAYGGFAPSRNTAVKITAASNSATLVSSNVTLVASKSQSILVTDINAGYQVTVLEDQSTPAPSGHS